MDQRQVGMSRPNLAVLGALLAGLIVVLGGFGVMKGGFFLGKHEGDTLHFLQIVMRMEAGQVPHLDFMTPIGALAFAPFAWLMGMGFEAGDAIMWSQVIGACLMAPAVFWVAASRLSTPLGALFVLVIMVLMLALVHGEAERTISISMHYNRWAWAAAFVAILAALLPPVHRQSALADGMVIGVMMVVLVMIKVTYFAAFALPVVLALVLNKQLRALGLAVLTGLVIAAVLTLWLGVDYWLAYLNDLMTVRGSEVRPQPGEDLNAVIVAPAYKGASLLAVVSVILLRQAKADVAGLILLLLVPGFFYVTYQNFGNDPQWLYLLPILILAFRPGEEAVGLFGWPLRPAMNIAAAMAMAFAMPSFFNLAFSPSRHYSKDVEDIAALVPGDPRLADLILAEVRATRVDGRVALDGPGTGLEGYAERADREEPVTFMGETFAYCSTELGLSAFMETIAKDLDAEGLSAGKSAFAADLFTAYWLYGGLEPVPGGAPWFYGGLPGYEAADYLLVPICPLAVDVQKQILDQITELGTDDLTEIRRTPLYILYDKG